MLNTAITSPRLSQYKRVEALKLPEPISTTVLPHSGTYPRNPIFPIDPVAGPSTQGLNVVA